MDVAISTCLPSGTSAWPCSASQALAPLAQPPEARVATFDQDGTLWVEHPMYTWCQDTFSKVASNLSFT